MCVRYTCPVCGYEGLENAVFINGEYLNTFEICTCCGFEFGFSEDHDVVHGFITIPEPFLAVAFQLYRKKWIEEGIRLFDSKSIPENKKNKDSLKFDVLVDQLKALKLDVSNFDIKGFEKF